MDYFHDLDVFEDGELLLLPPSFNTTPRDILVGDQELMSSGGSDEVLQDYDGLLWRCEYSKELCNNQECFDYFDHARNRMGRLRSFWAPSYLSDFQLYQDSGGAGTHMLAVLPNNFEWVFKPGRYGIYIETVNDRFIFEIADYQIRDDFPFDVLITKSQLSQKIVKREVKFMSLVRRVRYDSDRFTITHRTSSVGTWPYVLLERPHEASFLQKVSFSDLTVDYEHNPNFNSQVMLSPGYWDAESDPTTGQGGGGNAYRTNQTGALIEVETEKGTTTIGIVPNDLPYTRLGSGGRPLRFFQPMFAWRAMEVDQLGQAVSEWGN